MFYYFSALMLLVGSSIRKDTKKVKNPLQHPKRFFLGNQAQPGLTPCWLNKERSVCNRYAFIACITDHMFQSYCQIYTGTLRLHTCYCWYTATSDCTAEKKQNVTENMNATLAKSPALPKIECGCGKTETQHKTHTQISFFVYTPFTR